MIHEKDAHDVTSFLDALGEHIISPAWMRRIRRVIMGKSQYRGIVQNSLPHDSARALKKVPVFGKTNKKAVCYCTSEQFSDGQILNLFCLTQWLR